MTLVRSLAASVLSIGCGLAHAAGETPAVASHVYDFHAFLDDKPIGQHRFDVVVDGEGAAQARKVTSEADFTVRFMGFTAFHYHHHADEQWAGDCLSSLASTTDDDGKPASVHLAHDGDSNRIQTAAGEKSAPGCLMSYAYWNPAMRSQSRLLNPQTGKVDAVRVERAGTGSIPVGGQDVAATRWRITGGESPIDVWISDKGEWIGLDSMVANGKHKLTYRLP